MLNPITLIDGYKLDHRRQYPAGTTRVYSNWTPRESRVEGQTHVVLFGLQYFLSKYLDAEYGEFGNFFRAPRSAVVSEYKRRVDGYLGPNSIGTEHIAELHELGYIPLTFCALPEGTQVPLRVPMLTVENTHEDFAWLVNYFETLMSNVLWLPCTSATSALRMRQILSDAAKRTGSPEEFVDWQGHDFSFRGMPGLEAACLSGAAHLLSGLGTDTIPAIDFLEEYYAANCEHEVIGVSIPATEHSVVCINGQDNEQAFLLRLITEIYPTGPVSDVMDTWDFWHTLVVTLPNLRDVIMTRDGKLVVRPDSGDPVKIICGDLDSPLAHVQQGAIQVLWNTFGGTINAAGFKELDPHIGLIYGDSITPARQIQILERLAAAGFASSNVVLGVGSYTYQYVTRDTFGQAMKATYGETRSGGGRAIFKKPATDDGMKNSAVGLLCVSGDCYPIALEENVTWEREARGLLHRIFQDGVIVSHESLAGIRARIEAQL